MSVRQKLSLEKKVYTKNYFLKKFGRFLALKIDIESTISALID